MGGNPAHKLGLASAVTCNFASMVLLGDTGFTAEHAENAEAFIHFSPVFLSDLCDLCG